MSEIEKLDPKVKSFMKDLAKSRGLNNVVTTLDKSEIWVLTEQIRGMNPTYAMSISVDPYHFIWASKHSTMDNIADYIVSLYRECGGAPVSRRSVTPDLDKYKITSNEIITHKTPWEKINQEQKDLLNQWNSSRGKRDYQNIGNTARTLVTILADTVYNRERHQAPEGVDTSRGKFKNRLHTYIKKELIGTKNKEVKELGTSLIETTEKSIDLMSSLTHEEEASSFYAESCVLSTITLVRIVTLIHEQSVAT